MKDCVSLEVAQKLQKAGYGKQCLFGWYVFKKTGEADIYGSEIRRIHETDKSIMYPAPTATQLAEELPMRIKYNIPGLLDDAVLIIQKLITLDKKTFAVFYEGTTEKSIDDEVIPRQIGTLPDALGLMMCYLLENKMI